MVLKNLLNTVVLEIAKKNFKIKKVTMFDKNIYVSTIIDSYNYGTVLQAVAMFLDHTASRYLSTIAEKRGLMRVCGTFILRI